MDSALREMPSGVPAHNFVETAARPPNAMAVPAMSCRRVGAFLRSFCFIDSIILSSKDAISTAPHQTTPLKYVQGNILLETAGPPEAYFGASRAARRPSHAVSRRSPIRSKEKHCRKRAPALQPAWF